MNIETWSRHSLRGGLEMEARKDNWTSFIVELALGAARFDRQHACRLMAHGAVPIRVAYRVMLRQDQRRAAK